MTTADNLVGQSGRLSKREQQVASGLCAGIAPKQLAMQLGISIETVRKHRASLYRKLAVNSIVGLMRSQAPDQGVFFQHCMT